MARFDQLRQKMIFDLKDAFATSSNRQMLLAGNNFTNIVNAYRDNVASGPAIAKVNAELAALMRAAVLDRYKQNVVAAQVPSYRGGDRLSGQLLPALESETMAVGTQRGIGFIDERLLDSQAAHWRRLQFGALPATESLPARRYRVQFGSNQGFSMGLTDGPRAPFMVPAPPARVGYFLPSGQFFLGKPKGNQRDGAVFVRGKFSARGIGARRFLDAGLESLAENFGIKYRQFFENATRNAARRTRRR